MDGNWTYPQKLRYGGDIGSGGGGCVCVWGGGGGPGTCGAAGAGDSFLARLLSGGQRSVAY